MLRAWITTLLAALAAAGSANAGTRAVLGDGHASIVFPKPPGKMKVIDETPARRASATGIAATGFEAWTLRDGAAMFRAMALEAPKTVPAQPVCVQLPSAIKARHTCRVIQQDGVAGTEERMETAGGAVIVSRTLYRPGQTYEVGFTRFPAQGAIVDKRTPAQIEAAGQAFLDSLHVDPYDARDYPSRPWPPLPVPPVQH